MNETNRVSRRFRHVIRTCVGCRQRSDWSRLLRVVAARADSESGSVGVAAPGDVTVLVPDPSHRLSGRGAWLHPDPECLHLAERRRAFPRALRLQGGVDTRRVREYLEQ